MYMIKRDKSFYEFHFDIVFPPTRPRATGRIFYRRCMDMIVVLVILLIGVARFEKGRTCKQQFKTVDLYRAEPVSTGWFPVSTVAHFTSLSNYLKSVPPASASAPQETAAAAKGDLAATTSSKAEDTESRHSRGVWG